jgi:hypothetical protein
MKNIIIDGAFVLKMWNLTWLIEIAWECNDDSALQRMVIVKGQINICLKGKVGQFVSLLPGSWPQKGGIIQFLKEATSLVAFSSTYMSMHIKGQYRLQTKNFCLMLIYYKSKLFL